MGSQGKSRTARGRWLAVAVQPHHFELEEDTTGFGEYTRGGIVTQFKPAKTISFKTLAQALVEPGEFLLSDFSKMERSPQLHVAYQALDAFQVSEPKTCNPSLHRHTCSLSNCPGIQAKAGRMPKPGSTEDAGEVLAIAKSINEGSKDKVNA
eukprot:scaffold189628_cov45-Prasinocladus_malaysianus.AAC.1